MTIETPNKAWERQPDGEDQLRRRMREWQYGQQWLDALDVALAVERRATVERIRARLTDGSGDHPLRILDEEAAR